MSDSVVLPDLTPLLAQAPDAVLVIDEHGVVRFANPAAERLTGYKLADLVGQPVNRLLPAEIAAEHDGNIQHYWSAVLGRLHELSLRDSDERLIPVALKAVDLGTMQTGEDPPEHFFGAFLTDLRMRRALESQNHTLAARLEQEALVDSLTGLPNRRAFDAEAVRAMSRVARDGNKTLFAILDIDHFSVVNTNFGYAAGDAVLKTLARSVQLTMRGTDFFARIGGEEFGWLLPGITTEQAIPAVERIRGAVAATETSLAGHRGITMTISAGLTLLDPGRSLSATFDRADTALRKAKEQGRNRLIVL
jgi:diguanylate cyclase (GGDEF)-like protein/PAS domain S-box-containing protein